MKRILSALLILIFAFQVIPVRQVGSFLYQNLLTEELPHQHADHLKGNGDAQKNHDLISDLICGSYLFDSNPDYKQMPDQVLISRLADDIHTPPPNLIN